MIERIHKSISSESNNQRKPCTKITSLLLRKPILNRSPFRVSASAEQFNKYADPSAESGVWPVHSETQCTGKLVHHFIRYVLPAGFDSCDHSLRCSYRFGQILLRESLLKPCRFCLPNKNPKWSLRILYLGEFLILQPFLFKRVKRAHHFSPSRSVFIGSSESSRMSSSNARRSSFS